MGGRKNTVTLELAGDEDRLARSFDRTQQSAKQMEDSVTGSSRRMSAAADDMGNRFKKAGDDVEAGGKHARESFSAASGSLLATAAGLGLGVADAFGKMFERADVGAMLVAQLGGGAEEAQKYGSLAGKIYGENFGESVSDVGEALKGVIGSNLVSEDATDEEVKRLTEKLLTVSQVVGESTSAVSRAVSQMLKTGMAKSAEEAFDLVVRAQQQGINKSEDLLDTLNEYGTQFRKIGLDGPTALGLMSQAIRGGARDADTAADAIKEFAIRAVDGSQQTADAMQTLFGPKGFKKVISDLAKGGPPAAAALDAVLDKIRAVKDPAQQSQLAVALFGTKAEDLGAALESMDVSTAVAAMGQVQGATDKAMTAIGDTPAAKFESFKRNMEGALIDTLTKAAPLLESFGRFVADNINVLLPLAGIIGGIVVAQWAWNAAMEANPIVLVTELIVGLVAGLIILWNKSAAFRDAVTLIWTNLRDSVLGVVSWIRSAWDGLVGFFGALPMRIGAALATVGAVISGIFKGAVNAIVDAINWFLDHSLNWVINRSNDIMSVVGGGHIPTIPHIPRMHVGGVVPGMPGEETLAILQGGETVTANGSGGATRIEVVSGRGGNADVGTFVSMLFRKGYVTARAV